MVRRRPRLFITVFLSLLFIWLLLPYDNTFYLAIRWNAGSVSRSFSKTLDKLVAGKAGSFKVTEQDVGTIINTGWNPRAKLKAQLLAMGGKKTVDDVVVVADYESEGNVDFKGGKVKVHDVLASMLEEGYGKSLRLQHYLDFRAALEAGNNTAIEQVSGKELDIMKHVPGLELGYSLMPSKKWYLMIDDDTYIHTPSLLLLLSTLDHRTPYYLGNAVGAFTSRFGHGGSAILFSSAAMHKIFVAKPQVVKQAKKDSLTSEYGDEVVAKMAMRAGVYLSEEYNLHFNGEPPRGSFIRGDRFCAALVSFHKQSVDQIIEDFGVLGATEKPITWGEVGPLFGGPKVEVQGDDDGKVRWDWDFIGKITEEVRVIRTAKSNSHCALMCRGRNCLAWSFEKGRCLLAPWYTIGEEKKGMSTGLNRARVQELMRSCRK